MKGSLMRKYIGASIAMVLAVVVSGCGGSKGQAGTTASKDGSGDAAPDLKRHRQGR